MTSFSIDVQAIQSTLHAERGIARYVSELTLALLRRHDRAVGALVYNPDLPIDGLDAAIRTDQRFIASDDLRRDRARVHLVASPFEGASFDRILPPALRLGDHRLATILYDLIPLRFPAEYLSDPADRRRYGSRIELVRASSAVLCISNQTARDAQELLGVHRSRLHVINGAPAEQFRPPDAPIPASQAPILGVGGADWRKNLGQLVESYAQLAPALRAAHPLVVCGRLGPRADELRDLAARLGVADRLELTGVVDDDTLVDLYRRAAVVVATSVFEGYGLPVVEARASGAVVLASRASSFVELLPDEALFAVGDVEDLAGRLTGLLTDADQIEALRSTPVPSGHDWGTVADASVAAIGRIEPRRARPRRPRLAVTTPLPPAASGTADYAARLIAPLSALAEVHVFAPDHGTTRVPSGVGLHRLEHFSRTAASQGPFDAVVHSWGNNEGHVEQLPVMAQWPGIVMAHDVSMAGVLAWCSEHRPDLVAHRSFPEIVRDLHPDRSDAHEVSVYSDADVRGLSCTGDVVRWSERVLTHSAAAATQLVDDNPAHADRVGTIDFAYPTGRPRLRPDRLGQPPLIVSLGLVTEAKRPELLVEAFAEVRRRVPGCQLAFVGGIGFGQRRRLGQQIENAGLDGAVIFTGRVPREVYEHWAASADLAVQLRDHWGGEASAAIADAFAWGVPTVASAFGWSVGLPDDSVTLVPGDADAGTIAAAVAELLDDGELRTLRSRTSWQHARDHSFDAVARQLLALVG